MHTLSVAITLEPLKPFKQSKVLYKSLEPIDLPLMQEKHGKKAHTDSKTENL